MKCYDCGKDAVCISGNGNILNFAFCKECAIRRLSNKFKLFSSNLEEQDIWDDLFDSAEKRT